MESWVSDSVSATYQFTETGQLSKLGRVLEQVVLEQAGRPHRHIVTTVVRLVMNTGGNIIMLMIVVHDDGDARCSFGSVEGARIQTRLAG